MRYRATLAYDGTAYQGFQRQAGDTRTIQLALEQAIAVVTGQPVTVKGAGRTDTGVHASGQVIAFDVEWKHADDALLRAINVTLPPDIAVLNICQQPGFSPRHNAFSRLYRYRVLVTPVRHPLVRQRMWQIERALDGDLMQQAAHLLIGEHDFGAFGQPPRGENTVRKLFQSEWVNQQTEYGMQWTYTVEGTAFLLHMVRRMVWQMVQVGQGRMMVSAFEERFRKAKLVGITSIAPPQGLTLELVRYNE
ncbi:MAG: tRNA pseudouridine(38-40) synthase TruA [Anaerolineae bacterium]